MSFEDMAMFVLSNTGKTLSLEILKFFNDTGNVGNTITKQALSKQRGNIRSRLFVDLNETYINEHSCNEVIWTLKTKAPSDTIIYVRSLQALNKYYEKRVRNMNYCYESFNLTCIRTRTTTVNF